MKPGLGAALFCTIFLVAATLLAGEAYTTVPLGPGASGIEGMRLAALPHVQASLEQVPRGDGDKPALRVTFYKTGQERRLLALEAPLPKKPTDPKALSLRCRLVMKEGRPPRLALVAFEKDGGAWFRVSSWRVVAEEFTEVRLPVGSFKRAAFGQDTDEALRWGQVEKVWLGLVLDGPAAGTLELSRAVFTNEPYRPTQPLRVTNGGPGKWTVAHDRAARTELTTPNEGPDGKACMRFNFRFPGGRHMYAVPSTPLQEIELEGFRALRFMYRAELPKGIKGLLVMLIERDGTQYYADPAPPASKDWKTITISFGRLKRGGWSKDENDRLDLDDVGSVAVGVHGTASEPKASGVLWVTDIQFVP